MKILEGINFKGWTQDEEKHYRDSIGRYLDLCSPAADEAGTARQLNAIIVQEPRAEALGSLRMPVCVIHGRDDPLVLLPHGEATARAVPGSTFVVIDGMGHTFKRACWDTIVDAFIKNTARVGGVVSRSDNAVDQSSNSLSAPLMGTTQE